MRLIFGVVKEWREGCVMEDSTTSAIHIEYADDLRLRGGKGRA